MALSTARIARVRGRPPLLAAGITSLIHSHSSSVRSLGYIFVFIYPFYTTHEDFSDRLLGRVCLLTTGVLIRVRRLLTASDAQQPYRASSPTGSGSLGIAPLAG